MDLEGWSLLIPQPALQAVGGQPQLGLLSFRRALVPRSLPLHLPPHTQTSCPKQQCHLALASCQPAGSSLSCGNQGQTEAPHPGPPFYPECSLSTSPSFLPSSFRGKGTIPLAFSNLPLSQCLPPLLGSLDPKQTDSGQADRTHRLRSMRPATSETGSPQLLVA